MNSSAGRDGQAGPPAHEVVYRQLRDMVLFGDLVPGQAVTIQGLVERLDAGMTPVREALRRLTAEGALEALGNRRIVVPVLTRATVDELGSLRAMLEPSVAAALVARITRAEIDGLETIDTDLDAAIARGDISGYLRLNHAFHAEINRIAAQPILSSLIERLWLRFGPSLRMVCGQVGTRSLPDRHKDLITALRAGNEDAVRAALAQDAEQGMTLIRQGLNAAADSIDRA